MTSPNSNLLFSVANDVFVGTDFLLFSKKTKTLTNNSSHKTLTNDNSWKLRSLLFHITTKMQKAPSRKHYETSLKHFGQDSLPMLFFFFSFALSFGSGKGGLYDRACSNQNLCMCVPSPK
jgi:hypothetical protein